MTARSRRARYAIRPVRPAAFRWLVRHRLALSHELGGVPWEELGGFRGRYARWVRDQYARRRLVGFLAVAPSGEVVGSGTLWLRDDRPRLVRPRRQLEPRVTCLFVERPHRGSGAGAGLVAALVRWARDHGYPIVSLQSSRRAVPLYRRHGFRPAREMQLRFDRRRPRRRRPGRSRPARAR